VDQPFIFTRTVQEITLTPAGPLPPGKKTILQSPSKDVLSRIKRKINFTNIHIYNSYAFTQIIN